MARFYVSAWFDVDVDVPGDLDPSSDEYEQAVDEIIQDLQSSNAQLFTKFDNYHSHKIEADHLG